MGIRFPDGELGRWACLGAVTDRSVRVWLRDPRGAPQVATLEADGAARAQRALQPAPEHDWVAAADLTLDQPRPDADVLVRVAGMGRRARLAPAPGVPTAFTFGFGSCHEPFAAGRDGTLVVDSAAGIYPAMANVLQVQQARFLALVGDQVYSDYAGPINLREEARHRAPVPSEQELRDRYRWLYRGYFNLPGFRALLEAQPTLMIWDDHEIFEGWGSLLDWDEVDERVFRAASAAFREYQHLRNADAGVDDAAPYHSCFWFGDVGFFVLDLRGVRNFREGRLLGERQWHDLDGFLEEAADRRVATLFIVASVPVVHHAPALARLLERLHSRYGADIRDRWSSTPIAHERTRLLERLLTWQASHPRRQVVLLSGDVHAGAAFRIRRPDGRGGILQWTSSPMSTRPTLVEHAINRLATRVASLGDGPYRITRAALVPRNNFGLVRVAPLAGGGHRIELSLYASHASGVRVAARVVGTPSP